MIRLLARAFLQLLANAVGLLAASLLLSNFSIDPLSFIFVTILFTVIEVIAAPLILKIALSSARVLVGGIALVTTFVGLVLTSIFSDGLHISGVSTWIIATLIIWLCSLLASLILPLFIFKQVLNNQKTNP